MEACCFGSCSVCVCCLQCDECGEWAVGPHGDDEGDEEGVVVGVYEGGGRCHVVRGVVMG